MEKHGGQSRQTEDFLFLTNLKVTSATDVGVTLETDEAVTIDTDEVAHPVPPRYVTPPDVPI